jgi:formylglycine-generating enzyme required for sulfatase activity
MRISPIVLLLFTMFGCGSGTQTAKPPADSGDNQASPQQVATPDNHVATPASITTTEKATTEKTSNQLATGEPIVNSISMKLALIPAGEFQMGSPDSDSDARRSEKPQRLVKITKPFYLSAYVVTQQQYEKVMGTRPWQGKDHVQEGPDYPATHVSHDAVVEFCRKLSEKEGVEYRLPTEAEWEYACCAGTTTVYSFGDDASKLGQYAWYCKSASGQYHVRRVGQKLPNPQGLYDMHGNVNEWCQDWYERYGSKQASTDPMGPAQGKRRVLRGGSFNILSWQVRSASRYSYPPANRYGNVGFHPARTYPLSP